MKALSGLSFLSTEIIRQQQSWEFISLWSLTKWFCNILKAKPSLLDNMTFDQACILFIRMVQVACDLDERKLLVIMIDGLDETSRDSLKDTVTILSKLFKELKHLNAKVFISGQTDDKIMKPLYCSLQSNNNHIMHLNLDTSDPSSIEDVSKYLSKNFQYLVEEWDLNWVGGLAWSRAVWGIVQESGRSVHMGCDSHSVFSTVAVVVQRWMSGQLSGCN